MIVLYESTEQEFVTNGLGALTDAISCKVTEERNGKFELTMTYPIKGAHFSDIQHRRLILSKSTPFSNPQPFRIYNISKPFNGVVTINAEHISYDTTGYPVTPFVANNIADAISLMKSNCVVDNPFFITTDKTTEATMTVLKPSSFRSLLGGHEGSLLDVYTGEYEFDRFQIILHNRRGMDRGVTLRYGKNLTDLKQDENCSEVYTAIYPFWMSEDTGAYFELPEKYVNCEGTYNYVRIFPLDASSDLQDQPTEEELRSYAQKYIKDKNLGIPKVSIDVSFLQLAQSEEYAEYAPLEEVKLCDTVTVVFPEMNVNATAKCTQTVYDALTDRYDSITLGNAKSKVEDTLLAQDQTITSKPTQSVVNQVVDKATQLITGGLGGYVVMRSSRGDNGFPDEILIMDTDDIETAHNVWRWNRGGLGYSSTGYNGTYATAITQDGAIVANFITAGSMSADRLYGGTLNVGGQENQNGVIKVNDADGKTLVTLDGRGLMLDPSVMIAYNNLDGDATKIVNITKDTVFSPNIATNILKSSTVTADSVEGVTFQGASMVLGGTNDRDGTIEVKDYQGKTLVTLDREGIKLDPSVIIQFDNLGGDATKITQITKDTVYTEEVATNILKASNVVADSVSSVTFQGASMVIGGYQNQSGEILVKNSAGQTVIRLDRDGIALDESVKIFTRNLKSDGTQSIQGSWINNTEGWLDNVGTGTVIQNTVDKEYVEELDPTVTSLSVTNGLPYTDKDWFQTIVNLNGITFNYSYLDEDNYTVLHGTATINRGVINGFAIKENENLIDLKAGIISLDRHWLISDSGDFILQKYISSPYDSEEVTVHIGFSDEQDLILKANNVKIHSANKSSGYNTEKKTFTGWIQTPKYYNADTGTTYGSGGNLKVINGLIVES